MLRFLILRSQRALESKRSRIVEVDVDGIHYLHHNFRYSIRGLHKNHNLMHMNLFWNIHPGLSFSWVCTVTFQHFQNSNCKGL
mmetsp:Transcript_15154/g.20784  ORF Transcript_15154/g.20784 Transcript_15154/m.20784 type:complete len:83 (+) Transcript_15154:628-876(+)